jgi:hypothetical protein
VRRSCTRSDLPGFQPGPTGPGGDLGPQAQVGGGNLGPQAQVQVQSLVFHSLVIFSNGPAGSWPRHFKKRGPWSPPWAGPQLARSLRKKRGPRSLPWKTRQAGGIFLFCPGRPGRPAGFFFSALEAASPAVLAGPRSPCPGRTTKPLPWQDHEAPALDVLSSNDALEGPRRPWTKKPTTLDVLSSNDDHHRPDRTLFTPLDRNQHHPPGPKEPCPCSP